MESKHAADCLSSHSDQKVPQTPLQKSRKSPLSVKNSSVSPFLFSWKLKRKDFAISLRQKNKTILLIRDFSSVYPKKRKRKDFFFLYIVIFLVKHYYIVLGRFYILYLMNTFSASIVLGTLFTVHISVLLIVHCVYSVYSGVLSIVFIV